MSARCQRWNLKLAVAVGLSLVIAVPSALSHRETPSARSAIVSGKEELLFVFVGASFCGASREPGFPAAIDRIKRVLGREAARRNMAFATVGVGIDESLKDGLDFLETFGRFDEVILGRSWRNDGVDRFVRGAMSDESVPQVVVVSRHVAESSTTLVFTDLQVLAVVRGTANIRRWIDRGGAIESKPRRLYAR